MGVEPRGSPETELAFRVIADHCRAATMLLCEGVLPSNVERGYVLRRLIRRAVRYGELLGRGEPFLHSLVPSVVEVFKEPYPELKDAAAQAAGTMKSEEEKFRETLIYGERELDALLQKTSGTLPGEQAFKLYETFGFPLELTKEICAKRDIVVDEAGFKQASEKASDVARASWKGSGEIDFHEMTGALHDIATEFTGYESLQETTTVVASKTHADKDVRKAVLILEKTPFYPEGGGQVGDQGEILSGDGKTVLARVIDTQKMGSAILHVVDMAQPRIFKNGETVVAKVDAVRRNYVAPHHTATHLLNEALRRILGAHVRQAGSYVGADKLRFDFTHPKAVDCELLEKIEEAVAAEIRQGDPVAVRVDSIDKAREYGALTLLGEDYGERPRFVLIGAQGWNNPKERYSLELCGGTHVKSTADVAVFKILKESSVAAGVRRIEALAGRAVEDFERLKAQEEEQSFSQLLSRERSLLAELHALGAKAEELPPSRRNLRELRIREKELKELIARAKSKKLAEQARAGGRIIELAGTRLCAQRLEGADAKSLRGLSDKAKEELGSGLVFLAAASAGKLSFVLAATADLASKGLDAAKLAKAFAAASGGSAGGRVDFAQGGMPDGDWEGILSRLCEELKRAR